MIEPKYIQEEESEKITLNYEALRKKAISYIEQYSGNQWTDYNYHDPGITIMEQLCYAITDLGYRTNFPIADILLSNKDQFDLVENNLLLGPDKIFPTSAVNKADYRKLFLDALPTIKNIWINQIDDHPMGISGLYELQVQLTEDVLEFQEQETLAELKKLFVENRFLSTDIERITLLKKAEISFSGKLSIDSFAVGEDILAEIYQQTENYLSNENKEVEELSEAEIIFTERYTGPILANYSLKSIRLKNKTNEIYTSEIKDIIEAIPGVIAIEKLVVYKNGVKCFDPIVTFEKDTYPILEKLINKEDISIYQLSIYRNNTYYEIDTDIFYQLLDALTISDRKSYHDHRKHLKSIPDGRFEFSDVKEYFSIQKEFPAVYGLRDRELPSNSTKKRFAQAKQLKAYLLLFEQLMANHLSQLAHVRKLYSIDKEEINTYFNQVPTDIPTLESVLDFDSLGSFNHYLGTIAVTKDANIERKNQFLDHILARYGEEFDTTLLAKLHHLVNYKASKSSTVSDVLRAKMEYAQQIVDLGYTRGKAGVLINEEGEIKKSGLQKRIELLLSIEDRKTTSLTSAIFNQASITKVKKVWAKKNIEIEGGSKLRILSIEDDNYSSDDLEFYCKSYKDLKDLFLNAIKDSNYRIIQTMNVFSLFFSVSGSEVPIKLYHSDSYDKCVAKKEKAIKHFTDLNKKSEGIYMVENILLRPKLTNDYEIEIRTNNEILIFKSCLPSTLERQKELKESVLKLGKSAENYSVVSDQEGLFHLVIYDKNNNAVLKTIEKFDSKQAANDAIEKYVSDFSTKKKESKPTATLEKADSISHDFPEQFPYSNHLHFICPDWPLRFQNKEFKSFISECIDTYIPAHLSYTLKYLGIEQMKQFENVYSTWTTHYNSTDSLEKEVSALQLIQALKSYK